MKSKWLLRLYPRQWRDRYGDEMAALVAAERRTPRLFLDLVAGAIDARLNPQWTPRESVAGKEGAMTMARFFAHCRPGGVTNAEHKRSVAWMLGGTLVLSVVYIVLKRLTGESALVDAFGISLFPIALLVSSRGTYFKPYSAAARTVMIAGLIATVFVLSLLGSYIARLT